MSGPTFQQSATAPSLYWLNEPALPAGSGVAFLLANPGNTPPPSIDLAPSWTQNPGLYVCVGARPPSAQDAAFVTALKKFQGLSDPSLRFLWVADPGVVPANWPAQVMLVTQAPGAATGTLNAPAQLRFGRYIVGLARNLVIGLNADGFYLSGGDSWSFNFRTDSSMWKTTPPPPSGGSAFGTVISMQGAAAGCVLANLALPQDNGGSGIDDYTRLDVGCRFAIDDAAHPGSGLLLSLHYPVFTGVPAAGVALAGTFDPSLPLNAARTRLAFSGTVPAHPSNYRTALGYGVTLTPSTQTGDPLPAGLAFHRRPNSLHQDPTDDSLYLGPIGSFAVSLGQAGARLACGISGFETFALSAATGVPLYFDAGHNAYAPPPPVPSPTAQPAVDPPPSLTSLATCPYAAIRPITGQTASYYAQPDEAALYQLRPATTPPTTADAYLVYADTLTGNVAAATVPPPAYPFLPYAGVQSATLALYSDLEERILGPTRKKLLQLASAPTGPGSVTAVTPQGLIATFNTGLTQWKTLGFLAPPSATVPSSLAFNLVDPTLQQALQTNQLFLVAADGNLLLNHTDLNYWLTPAALADLAALPDSERPPPAVLSKLTTPTATAPQSSLAAFQAMLQGVLTAPEQQYIPVITRCAAYFELVVAGWRFRLSPGLWNPQTGGPAIPANERTFMIVKFTPRSLRDMVNHPHSWTWSDLAKVGGSLGAAQSALAEIIAAADAQLAAAAGQPHDLDFFVQTIVDDPAWTGVVFLNANVPFTSMPEELRGLAAGIDATKFRAHHIGLSISPVQVDTTLRTLSLGPSAIFGLIDYNSPEDIPYCSEDFDFKVLLLRVLFRNSAIANFASRIELFVNTLFADAVIAQDTEHYNNLILYGSYQRQQNTGHYVFATTQSLLYATTNGVLESVEFVRAQFNTLAADPSSSAPVRSRFLLWGRQRFKELAGFDAFSFGWTLNQQGGQTDDGYLAFSGLAVDMQFLPSDTTTRTFALNLGNIAFDTTASIARDTSCFARFPMKLTGLIRGEAGQTPKDLGYLAVETPLNQPALKNGWFGLTYSLDLGTLGALAADAGLVVTLITAWAPGSGQAAVNVGLRLPGAQAIKDLPAIEGVLQLGFQSISFEADGARAWPRDPSYVMRFRRFTIGVLKWKLPPGQADIYLFGDPHSGPQQRGALGWYAAYVKD